MKIIFTLLTCFAFSSLLAETIGNVEYELPKIAQDWEIGSKTIDDNGTTILYIPKGIPKEDLKEFFAVNANSHVTNLSDLEGFKAVFIEEYPDMQVEVKVLDQGKENILYEWAAKDKGQERIHGWGRIFSSKEGTVLLEYETENAANFDKASDTWLPILKKAKVVEKTAPAADKPK